MEYENFIENFGFILNTIVYSQATGHKQPTSSLNTLFHRNAFIRRQELKYKSILENFHFILSLHIKNIWNFPIVRNGLFDKQLQLKIHFFY